MQREGEIKRIYLGSPDAEQLLKNYGVDYAVIGPLERVVTPPNEQFFSSLSEGRTSWRIQPLQNQARKRIKPESRPRALLLQRRPLSAPTFRITFG